MAYAVEFKRSAERELAKLDKGVQRRVVQRLQELADEPRPSGVVKLSGEENLYRVREGDWRIIYQINDNVLVVLVVKIGNRRDVYR